MGKASSRKGAQAERDVAEWLCHRFGYDIKRMLGAGRAQDVGDIHGLPMFTVQVANWANVTAALREKPLACEVQQGHGRTPFGITFLKLPPRPGGKPAEWRVVMTPAQFAEVYDILRTLWDEAE